jgi:pyruvate kinase
VLERLIRAGVDVVRLNFSHGKAQDHIDRANWCAHGRQGGQAGGADGRPAGPEDPRRQVRRRQGDAGRRPALHAGRARTEPGDVDAVGLDYKELPRDVRPGDTLLLNDGLIVLTVDAVRGEQVHTW